MHIQNRCVRVIRYHILGVQHRRLIIAEQFMIYSRGSPDKFIIFINITIINYIVFRLVLFFVLSLSVNSCKRSLPMNYSSKQIKFYRFRPVPRTHALFHRPISPWSYSAKNFNHFYAIHACGVRRAFRNVVSYRVRIDYNVATFGRKSSFPDFKSRAGTYLRNRHVHYTARLVSRTGTRRYYLYSPFPAVQSIPVSAAAQISRTTGQASRRNNRYSVQ